MAKKPDTKAKPAKKETASSNASKDEQIGFHKGSLMTLAKERQEMIRIVGIVEQLMQMHAAALNEMGVKIDEQTASALTATPQQQQAAPKKKPPIEDIL